MQTRTSTSSLPVEQDSTAQPSSVEDFHRIWVACPPYSVTGPLVSSSKSVVNTAGGEASGVRNAEGVRDQRTVRRVVTSDLWHHKPIASASCEVATCEYLVISWSSDVNSSTLQFARPVSWLTTLEQSVSIRFYCARCFTFALKAATHQHG